MNDPNHPQKTALKKIVVFCDSYLPSTKSGGGMWTVVNLIDRFCDRFEFFVVTRNYDSKADTKPFTSVKTGSWNQVGNAKVYYVASSDLTQKTCATLVNEIRPDGIFLNSTMSTPVVKFLMARRNRMVSDIPVVVSPCGEVSEAALTLKPLKKWLYFRFAKIVNLFNKVIWKASSAIEAAEIRKVTGARPEIMIAPDLAPKTILPDFSIENKPKKETASARFIFLSRIVRKKNLRYFLERLKNISSGNVTFDIVGPVEDRSYWKECLDAMRGLPSNVKINVVGTVSYQDGLELLLKSHFFALPTISENFGYVFLESLAAGTPLLISDQTIWNDVEQHDAGWIIPLANTESWLDSINRCIEMDDREYRKMSLAARKYAEQWLAQTSIEEATAQVFKRAFGEMEFVSNG